MTPLLLLLLALAGVVALFLIPMVIGAFFELLPYLIVLAVLYWLLF